MKDFRDRKARSALAKANTVSINVESIYEDDRQKFQALSQDLGITFDGNNNVDENNTNDRLDALEAGGGSGVTDHTLLTNIGTNTHAQIDTHIADTDIHVTLTDKATWDNKSDFDGAYDSLSGKPTLFSGSYDDLTNKPTIPTNNNELTNGAGYITSYTETDPIFTAWDKSTGISITESQISDFGSYEPSDSTIVKDASYVHTDNNYTTTEKNKLSGIESGAEVNPTGTEIVSAIDTELGSSDWQSSGGGTSKEYASFYLSGAGATGLTSTEVTLTLNATSVNSNGSVFSLSANTVTVNKTGNFEINANVYLNNSSTSRTEYSMWIEKNGTEVAGTRFASYQRGYDSGMSSGVNFMVTVTSGDTFTIQCKRTDGNATAGYQDANGTRFNIKEL